MNPVITSRFIALTNIFFLSHCPWPMLYFFKNTCVIYNIKCLFHRHEAEPTINEMKWIGPLVCTYRLNWARRTFWHSPPDTEFEIQTLEVWGRARYLSVPEAPHNTEFHEWIGEKHFCFFQTAETGKRTPWKAAVLTTTPGPPPKPTINHNWVNVLCLLGNLSSRCGYRVIYESIAVPFDMVFLYILSGWTAIVYIRSFSRAAMRMIFTTAGGCDKTRHVPNQRFSCSNHEITRTNVNLAPINALCWPTSKIGLVFFKPLITSTRHLSNSTVMLSGPAIHQHCANVSCLVGYTSNAKKSTIFFLYL